MPISAAQYRIVSGSYNSKRKNNIYQRAFINSVSSETPAAGEHFTASIIHAENSAARAVIPLSPLTTCRSAISFAVQVLLILNHIRSVEAAPFTANETRLSLPFNTSLSDSEICTTLPALQAWPVKDSNYTVSKIMPVTLQTASNKKDKCKDTTDNAYIVTGEEAANKVFAAVKDFFISGKLMTAEQSEDYIDKLRIEAAGYPIIITTVEAARSKSNRSRRALDAAQDPKTAEHIKEFCADDEEILNTDGGNAGKILLFQAQRDINPFRRTFDNTHNGPTPEERGVADGLNLATDIITFGIKPLVGNLMANAKRQEYYQNAGDPICATRYRHLSVAEIVTSVDAEAIPFTHSSIARRIKPKELANANLEPPRAAFYTQNKHTKIRQEVLLNLKKVEGSINDNGRKIYLLSTDKENEFMTYHPHAVDPKKLERKVIVDPDSKTWRYADQFDTSKLEVGIEKGKRYIKVEGDYYELNQNSKGGYDIVVNKKTGIKEFIPVYMEPLSRTWHMQVSNEYPVFNHAETTVINKIKVEPNVNHLYIPEKTNNPSFYKAGVTYRAEKLGDTSHYVEGRYIELQGELVPVRQKVTHGHGVRYEVYDDIKGYPVEWDGARWIFERPTSVQVSTGLNKMITQNMFAKEVDASKVSARGYNGLQWDNEGNSYLKIRDNYVKVKKTEHGRYRLITPEPGPRVILRFSNKKFRQERFNERLKIISTVGCGGNKRKYPADVLVEAGYTKKDAEELLARFDLPEDGLHDPFTLVLEIEQTGKIPDWANKYQKVRIVSGDTGKKTSSGITVTKSDDLNARSELPLGEKIKEGRDLFENTADNFRVIKKYAKETYSKPQETAEYEAEVVNTYYGEGNALVFRDGNGNFYVDMYKIPGENVNYLPAGSLPANRADKLVDMVEKVQNAQLGKYQLDIDNLMWDSKSETFSPVDINNINPTALSSSSSTESINSWHALLDDIIDSNSSKSAGSKSPAKNNAFDALAIPGPSGLQKAQPKPGTRSQSDALAIPGTSGLSGSVADTASSNRIYTPVKMDGTMGMTPSALEAKLKTSSFQALLQKTTEQINSIRERLDFLAKTIATTKNPSLQKIQLFRLDELKKVSEDALNTRTAFSRIDKFIEHESAEVLNPGLYTIGNSLNKFNYQLIERNTRLFNVRNTEGSSKSMLLLYPEDNHITLYQQPLRRDDYTEAVNKLTLEERGALRSWSALPAEIGRVYNNGEISDGFGSRRYLNAALAAGRETNYAVYNSMQSALQPGKIPVQPGEYVLTNVYKRKDVNPWATGSIDVGEYVTNHRQLVSVSGDAAFAKKEVLKQSDNIKAIVTFKITTAKGPVPLVPGELSFSSTGTEYLYKPNTYFTVKEYSLSFPYSPFIIIRGANYRNDVARIGVLLEEVSIPAPGDRVVVKEMFSGKKIN